MTNPETEADSPPRSPRESAAGPLPLPSGEGVNAGLAHAAAPSKAADRYAYIDNLRVFIIMMVLAHHSGNPYVGEDFWYYKSSDPKSPLVGLVIMLNTSFSMATLLVFSGFLLPSSYDRHGFAKYVREKFIRLGIPLVFGGMVMLPLVQYTFHLNFGHQGYRSFLQYYWEAWHGMGQRPENWEGPGWPDRNLSHLWYIEHLLFYALCYAVWRRYFCKEGPAEKVETPPPGNLAIFLFAVGVSLLTFVVRIRCPYNRVYALFGFLQIDMSHLPLWLPFFFVGLFAYKHGWMNSLPKKVGMRWLRIGIFLAIFNFCSAYVSPWNEWFFGPEAWGGFHLANLFRSSWEAFFCVGISVGLMVLFREYLNERSRFTVALAANAYAVHVFHPPMIVGLQYLFGPVPLPTFFKFLGVSLVGIVVCFTVSHFVIRRIPYARRIL